MVIAVVHGPSMPDVPPFVPRRQLRLWHQKRAEQAAHCIAETIAAGFRVVIIHGNGPQVGNLLLQMESAAERIPPSPLDVAVAATQGTMGYSPLPIKLIEAGILHTLVEAGIIVMAGGGGGIPVVREPNGMLRGIEAVIDKDRTAVLLTRAVCATHLIILTEAEYVHERFGHPDAKPIVEANASRMAELLAQGEFPSGNMGPKIEAALDFLASGGQEVIITSLEALPRATGTRIHP